MNDTHTLRIGELAERAGVNIQTVRYYERRGLLAHPVRSTGGHREYDADALAFLRGIRTAQRLGFTLTEIEEITELTSRRRDTRQVRERAEAKIQQIDEKVRALLAMRASLEQVIEAECDSLVACSCAGTLCCPIRDIAEMEPHEVP